MESTANMNRDPIKRFSIIRFVLILLTCFALFILNPGNELPEHVTNGFQKIGIYRYSVSEREITNYRIFSLEAKQYGLWLYGLNRSKLLCRFSDSKPLCSMAAKELCRGELLFWEEEDLPSSVLSLFLALLVLSRVTTWIHLPFPTFNVLYQPRVLDLLCLPYVYIALVAMYDLLAARMPDDPVTSFLVNSTLLICGIGFLGNSVATFLSDVPVTGIGAIIGASRGYLHAIAFASSSFVEGNSGTMAGGIAVEGIFWLAVMVNLSFGRLMALAFGAVGGYMLAHAHLSSTDDLPFPCFDYEHYVKQLLSFVTSRLRGSDQDDDSL